MRGFACSRAAAPEFRYSAALSGWLYASNQLWKYDPSSYEELYGMLPENARRDLAANDAFWAKYEGKIAEVSNQINDAYLKIQWARTRCEKVTTRWWTCLLSMCWIFWRNKKRITGENR